MKDRTSTPRTNRATVERLFAPGSAHLPRVRRQLDRRRHHHRAGASMIRRRCYAQLDARGEKPAIAWSTIARAERLARQGAGWSADHVLRRALHAPERERLEGTKA